MVQREIGLISRLFFYAESNLNNGFLHEVTAQQKGVCFVYGNYLNHLGKHYRSADYLL